MALSLILVSGFPLANLAPHRRSARTIPSFSFKGSVGGGAFRHDTFLLALPPGNVTAYDQDDNPPAATGSLFSQVDDWGMVICDMFAILVACQLIGLLEILNDPEFGRNKGWLQPIPAVPSTLGFLVQRIVLFSSLWFPLSLVRTFKNQKSNASGDGWIGPVLQTITYFSVIRVAIAVVSSLTLSGEIHWFEALRDAYVMGLGVVSFRFLYDRYIAH